MGYKTFADGDVLTAGDVNTYLMRQSVIVCTSVTHPGSLTDGMVNYETDVKKLLLREGSAWRRIPKLTDSDPGPWTAYENANDTSGSLSYVAGTSHGVAFTAPPSGAVYVTVTAGLGTNSILASSGSWLSFEVRTGSTVGLGSVSVTADNARSAGPFYPNNPTAGYKYTAVSTPRVVVTGLVAGSSYNVRSMFKSDVSGATAGVINRYLTVDPVL